MTSRRPALQLLFTLVACFSLVFGAAGTVMASWTWTQTTDINERSNGPVEESAQLHLERDGVRSSVRAPARSARREAACERRPTRRLPSTCFRPPRLRGEGWVLPLRL